MANLGTGQGRLPCPTCPGGLAAQRASARPYRVRSPALVGIIPHPPGAGPPGTPLDPRRGLYWPSPVPLPACMRWLPAGLLTQNHQGAGAIVAAFALPDEWIERWPYLPGPTGIELVHLNSEGLPVLDRPEPEGGLGKRSYGIRQGAVCLLGDPRPESAVGINIVEGLGVALALASRAPETAAAFGGVSGLQADNLVAWLSRWLSVTVYADGDPDGID